MKSFLDYLNEDEQLEEGLKTQADLLLFKEVLQSKDIEIKFIPKYGSDSIVKVRSKSVDKNKVFTMYIKDIELRDIGSSMNINF